MRLEAVVWDLHYSLYRYGRDLTLLYDSAFHWRNDILDKLSEVVFVTRSAMNLDNA